MLTPALSRNPYMDRLPALGAIVTVHIDRELMPGHRWRKFRVVSYPGVDLTMPFNRRARAHLVNLEALDNRWTTTVSGFYCETVEL